MQDGREHATTGHSPRQSPVQTSTAQSNPNLQPSLPHLLPYSPAYVYPVTFHHHPVINHIPYQTQPVAIPPVGTGQESGSSNRSHGPPSRSSSGGKTFTCTGYEGCSMSFSRSEHLARHVRKHTGEKPFTCRCGKKFTRLDNLRQHASTIHSDEPEANEELFARLAAHMPRSGRSARRKTTQSKATTSDSPETSFSSQPENANASHEDQQDVFQSPVASTSQIRTHSESDVSRSPQMHPPATQMETLPQPLPSPSFRFPASSSSAAHQPAPFYPNHQPYTVQAHSTLQPQSQHLSYAPEQHLNAQNTSHPSQAMHDGRGGSSFRVTQHPYTRTAGVQPSGTGVDTGPAHQLYNTSLHSYSGITEHPRQPSAFTSKPVLPSLSSLIAGEPLTTSSPHIPQIGIEHSVAHDGDSQYHTRQHPHLDSTLLVAAEMAMHHSAVSASMVPHSMFAHDSRSSSFSTSSGSTSAALTAATSPPPLNSPCSPIQSG